MAEYATKTLATSDMVSKNDSVQGTTVLKEFINPNMFVVLTLLSASPGSEKNQPIRGLLKGNYTGLLKTLSVRKSIFSYLKFKIQNNFRYLKQKKFIFVEFSFTPEQFL